MALVLLLLLLRFILSLRVVVPTNAVHIVRRGRKTLVYGNTAVVKDGADEICGNTYYRWPQWVPGIGVTVSTLPLSVFDIDIKGYDAYDKDRLPFVVDVKAFFRISDYKVAAERVEDFGELKQQLLDICRGASRTILAKEDLEVIMSERSKYGQTFTNEVKDQLKAWGVEPVKSIELMDIRDAKDEEVISNIMKKKKSGIEKESREQVAKNDQAARIAELEAKRDVDLRQAEADEMVGLRKAQKDREVGIANQQATQAIKEEAKVTTEKEMEVKKVETVRQAEIAKEKTVVEAQAEKQRILLEAEAKRGQKEMEAEADLVKATKNAEGIKAEGLAKADAEKEMQLASVAAQTTLAKEVGDNKNYQEYLIEIRKVEAQEAVGVEQAKNISGSQIKIIANAGEGVQGGLTKALDLFSPKGGAALGQAIEAFGATEAGQKVLQTLAAIFSSQKDNPQSEQ